MNVFATGFFAAGFFASGFFASGDESPVEVPVVQTGTPSSSAGGVGNDAGTGYIWRDHAWVKATKTAKVGFTEQTPGKTTQRVVVGSVGNALRTRSSPVTFSAKQNSEPHTNRVCLRRMKTSTKSNSLALSTCTSLMSSRYNGTYEALSLDEILTILDATT